VNESKIQGFWKRNRSLFVLGMRIFFISSTIIEIIIGILFLFWDQEYYFYTLTLFASAFASGCIAFGLVRSWKKTS
jgi:polyferredoxin